MLLRLDLLSLATFSLSTVWSLAELPLASAQLVNVTIDDTFGDQLTGTTITYLPPDVWKLGQDCSDCFAKLDQTKVSNGTWHDGTFSAVAENNGPANRLLTATVTFQGVAVYVFCAVAHSFSFPVGRSDMTFLINGTSVGNFTQEPTGDGSIDFDIPVFSSTSLPFGQHTISIVNGHLNGAQSLTLLDRIVYSRDISSTSTSDASLMPTDIVSASSSSSSATAMAAAGSDGSSRTQIIIIAAVASIGGVLVLVVIVTVILCLRKRRRRHDATTNGVIVQDAARIEDEDPEGSGWVEGTWTGDDDSGTVTSTRRTGSLRRKRKLSNAHSPTPPVPPLPSAALSPANTQGPIIPPAVSEFQTYRIAPSQISYARADPTPTSPTSSFGNLTSTVPDSATYFISTFPTSGFPKHSLPAAIPNPPPHPPSNPSDTFLDMGRSFSQADAGLNPLSSRAAHPFANPSAVAPSAYVRQQDRPGRQRSDSDQSTRSNRSQRGHAPSGGGSATVPPSASTSALASAQRSQARGPVKKTSGSDLASASDVSSIMSPSSSALQTVASTATTPTSTTMLMPKRQPSNAGASQFQSHSHSHSRSETTPAPSRLQSHTHTRSQPQSQPQSLTRARSAPRRVDPVDPSINRTREPAAVERQRSDRRREQGRERERERERSRDKGEERERDRGQAQAPAPVREEKQRARRGGRRQGVVVLERDREQFGNFLDVPQDAGDRPPSYRES